MDNAYVVGYGMIDVLGNNPKDCFLRMLDDNDYSTVLPHMVEENHKIQDGYVVDEWLSEPIDPKTGKARVLLNFNEWQCTLLIKHCFTLNCHTHLMWQFCFPPAQMIPKHWKTHFQS